MNRGISQSREMTAEERDKRAQFPFMGFSFVRSTARPVYLPHGRNFRTFESVATPKVGRFARIVSAACEGARWP